MDILTDTPVDLSFSNSEGGKISPEALATIGQTAAQIGAGLTQRQRQFTEVEQKCGKRPSLPGKRRNTWDACAKEFAKSSSALPSFIPSAADMAALQTQQRTKVPTWVWIVTGVVGLGVVGFIVYRATKK